MAGDPEYVPLLIGLGIEELSVAAPRLLPAKREIRRTELMAARELAGRALTAGTAGEVEAILGWTSPER
jgi:phosphoenolpyruvate-protein kinase (PTS system EI component)